MLRGGVGGDELSVTVDDEGGMLVMMADLHFVEPFVVVVLVIKMERIQMDQKNYCQDQQLSQVMMISRVLEIRHVTGIGRDEVCMDVRQLRFLVFVDIPSCRPCTLQRGQTRVDASTD